MTQGSMQFHSDATQWDTSPVASFPARWQKSSYGTLIILPPQSHQSWLMTVGFHFARTCGWLLHTVEHALATLSLVPDTPSFPREDVCLTRREQHVLQQMIAGQRIRVIAEHLDISVGTVRNHQHHLYQKLGVSTAQEAIAVGRMASFVR